MSLMRGFRSLLHGSDARRAAAEERRVLGNETGRRDAHTERFKKAYCADARDAVTIGHAVDGGWPIRLSTRQVLGHWLVAGPTGVGKTWFAEGLSQAFLAAGVRVIATDPKGELLDLRLRGSVHFAKALPPEPREAFIRRLVLLDPHSKRYLPRRQLLALPEGEDAELWASLIASLITTGLDMGLGIRQEAMLHRPVECLVRAGLPITVLPEILKDPGILDALADGSGSAELFRSTARSLAEESGDRRAGILARLDRLLRYRPSRLSMGGADANVDYRRLLDEHHALISTSSPPGLPEIGRCQSGETWLQLGREIRRRPHGAPPAIVIVDEFPTVLGASGPRVADAFEDELRLARSKNVFFVLMTQDMASIAKIAPSLPDVTRNNVHLFCVFRAPDPQAWDFLLPVTGRRPRPKEAPWEESRPGFLDRGGELALLREELSRLPDRVGYLVDRRTGLPGVRMRTADLVLDASEAETRALAERASRGPFTASVDELERGDRAVRERVARLLGRGEAGAPRETKIRRRSRGSSGLG